MMNLKVLSLVTLYVGLAHGNFLEPFDIFDTSKWIQSTNSKYGGQKWAHADGGIQTVTPHKFYGLSHVLDDPVEIGEEDFVMQYEVKFTSGVTCSGSYVKLLIQDDNFKAQSLVEDSPYSIMFGPDNCGNTKKVHVIFRQENPKTGKWEEKHMSENVASPSDSLPHLYTLIVRKDNTFSVLIDNEVKSSGSLLDGGDFSPAFQPPKEIDDPEDKKPSDWVDTAKIPDPAASKPDDWDEDAPKQIIDPDAVKPSGWNDDEPLEIADPSASQPDDWDEDDDGEWEAPLIKNPKCSIGCGEWKPPIIANPNYKGKWSAPLIDNPAYIGEWKPRRIPNPGYFEDTNPVATLKPIGAIAIEILANDKGIHFDNFMIGNDVDEAITYATTEFLPARELEKQKLKEKKLKDSRAVREREYENGGIMGKVNYYVGEALDRISLEYEREPKVILAGGLAAGSVFLLVLKVVFFGGGSKAEEDDAAMHKKDDDVAAPIDEDDEESDEDNEQEADNQDNDESNEKDS